MLSFSLAAACSQGHLRRTPKILSPLQGSKVFWGILTPLPHTHTHTTHIAENTFTRVGTFWENNSFQYNHACAQKWHKYRTLTLHGHTDQNIRKYKKTFPMGSKVRTKIAQISKCKIYDKSEWCNLFYIKHIKNVKFLSDGRGPHGPDLPSPCGLKFQFQFSRYSFFLVLNYMVVLTCL